MGIVTFSVYNSTTTETCSVCACLDLSVSSSSWGLGRAAVCDCGTPWTFLVHFFEPTLFEGHPSLGFLTLL